MQDVRTSNFGRLIISLMNHEKEMEVIKRKIVNPDVSELKKGRLRQRLQDIRSKIIPRIERAKDRCMC